MRLLNPARLLAQTRKLHHVSTRLSLRPYVPDTRLAWRQQIVEGKPNRLARVTVVKHPQRCISGEQTARDLNQQGIDEALSEFDSTVAEEGKDKQLRAPWHRQGAQEPPVRRQRSAGAMTKGKLLKLVLPLTTIDQNSDRKDVAPLALLVHPQQPLSYLERLIQSELPTISTDDGNNKVPSVSFRAMEATTDEIKPVKKLPSEKEDDQESQKGSLGEGGVESYSGAGREGEGEDQGDFVRWSASTEIGDFIRDAARAKEFEVEIEGSPRAIKVAVPSFNDRTFYLRQRLRKTSKQIADMAAIKKECDLAAHRSGQRLAMGGCGLLIGWWYVVYRLTFETDLGWDVMEPVTYLVGLSTIIGGYMWFLYHNREVSYRSALNLTISRRQSKLYELKGFDIQKWEALVEEANAIRKEVKAVAAEYDVEWDEAKDEHGQEVSNVLREERKKEKGPKKNDKEEGEDDD
ncbi:hypothetical protein PV08_10833 [Exophiala spinifera]|uniref:Calcium uniporter protein n=1 Tax=Exophiala spinifera TaxID=91928 RepID=A0A0D1ZF06_9EURO|nr:uncharacterized protein PV08_10833 [Exophiala spinifera]KIW11532.1 hypothetical protein PV08_10833 [Exophiala spinifera]